MAQKAPADSGSPWSGLLAGLDTLGVNRKVALRVIRAAALDSVPPNRRAAYDYLTARTGKEAAKHPDDRRSAGTADKHGPTRP